MRQEPTPPVNILHLLSNRKWTERSEPVADLVRGQQTLGHAAEFVCGRWPAEKGREQSAEEQARRKGLEPIVLRFDKHFRLGSARQDVPRLRDLITAKQAAVVHAHLPNAHLIAALATRPLDRPPLRIASSYEPDGPESGVRNRYLLHHYTDGLVVIGEKARTAALRRGKLSAEQIAVIEPGVDTEFFSPQRAVPGNRRTFGLEAGHFVMGMVTRIRPDRRVDLAVRALGKLASDLPDLRFLLVGRGEAKDDMLALAESLGVRDRLVWAGYRTGDELVAALRAMNFLVYPAAGTDKSCRTIREAMAAGVPVLGSRSGFIQELIEDHTTGRFIELAPERLAAVIKDLHADRGRLSAMGEAALRTAHSRFRLELQARQTVAFYDRLLSARARLPTA